MGLMPGPPTVPWVSFQHIQDTPGWWMKRVCERNTRERLWRTP